VCERSELTDVVVHKSASGTKAALSDSLRCGHRAALTEFVMDTKMQSGPRWSTASYGDEAAMSPADVQVLGEHLCVCRGGNGRMFALRCEADTMQGFVAARFVTTVAVCALLTGVLLLAI
jgi:hypothetical protein